MQSFQEPPTVHIRRLDETVLAGYKTLRLRALKEDPTAFTSSLEEEIAKDQDYWKKRLSASHVQMYGAIDKKHVCGMAGIVFTNRRKQQHKATLIAVYVEPEYRGKGIGKRLIATCLEKAFARRPVERVTLTVTGDNATALGLYERMGFYRWGEEPAALKIDEHYYSKIHMVLPASAWEGKRG